MLEEDLDLDLETEEEIDPIEIGPETDHLEKGDETEIDLDLEREEEAIPEKDNITIRKDIHLMTEEHLRLPSKREDLDHLLIMIKDLRLQKEKEAIIMMTLTLKKKKN